MTAAERTPLLSSVGGDPTSGAVTSSTPAQSSSWRTWLFLFLEARTTAGRFYERLIILLIGVNVAAFILGTVFVEPYNASMPSWTHRNAHDSLCNVVCDTLWFGNYRDNDLAFLGIGSVSYLEIVTVAIFTVEYILRLMVVDMEEDPNQPGEYNYKGFVGRLRYAVSFYSLVDLASTVPFYVDAFFLPNTDLATSSFLRMFRLFRMMRGVEGGRYHTALLLVDDVYAAQKGILGTALFVGVTVWLTVSALYYLTERRNFDMIYCPTCLVNNQDKDDEDWELDTALCDMDVWGRVNCTRAGCPATADTGEYPCYNMYESIPMASYYALLNLFGEFPLMQQHSSAGQWVGTFTAVIAVAVFALPAGIIGNGFETVIEQQRQQATEETENNGTLSTTTTSGGFMTVGYVADTSTTRGRLYNLLHGQEPTVLRGALYFDRIINALVLMTALTFMVDTVQSTQFLPGSVHTITDALELTAVIIFTLEYVGKVYACVEDPKYNGMNVWKARWNYMGSFLALVDLLSVVPYWILAIATGGTSMISSISDATSTASNIVKSLRLLRILRFERYTQAFTTFDDVFRANADLLAITAFSALLLWVFFSAYLYLTERDNPDPEMAANYNHVPNAMWMTLLNLSGESPLAQYSAAGKIATGLLGLFATGIFGIPIGVLGAGFEEFVQEENQDNTEELEGDHENGDRQEQQEPGSQVERALFRFVNGIGSVWAMRFELLIYFFIFCTIGVGVWQTMDGHENDFSQVEWIAVVVFTLEYVMRFVGAGADPEFAKSGRHPILVRFHFILSFYSVIDLLAIVPFYVASALPNSAVNDYDEYLRMLRILRLVKLDKYIPSITLIDDVIRLKFNTLRVAFFAAMTLWLLFAAALFLCEHNDTANAVDDPLPEYGCHEDCTMQDRFQNFFDSMVYTGIHLTGDYPITTYSWPSRFVNFFMVIAAVGVVSIPSGVIASGFVEIVQSKNKKRRQRGAGDGQQQEVPPYQNLGDDWYEVRLRELEGVDPPPSALGPKVDAWQNAVNEFLNGRTNPDGTTTFTPFSQASRVFIFTVIVANVIAVLAESVPSMDAAVGNEPGNFFDVFETFSVMVFAVEYVLRLFCAPKSRQALYSTWIYATTFFGIVDFLSTAPWFLEKALVASHVFDEGDDNARIFRIFRIFRILQLEDFIVAFSKLDNVFRASMDVLKATGLMALIIWIGCGALFYIFEENNPNWRSCDSNVPLESYTDKDGSLVPGCYDFVSTAACNEYYVGSCHQTAFVDMPNTLYYTAVFLGGEWGVVDFTWPGRCVCLFLCVVGIALYAIPIGTLFDSFGAVLGLAGDDEEEEEEEEGAGGDNNNGGVPQQSAAK